MSVDLLRPTGDLASLYVEDETDWLDAMAAIAREGRLEELDLAHLAEFLEDMAERERREVESRLVVLLMHHLKWNYQPEKTVAELPGDRGRATAGAQADRRSGGAPTARRGIVGGVLPRRDRARGGGDRAGSGGVSGGMSLRIRYTSRG